MSFKFKTAPSIYFFHTILFMFLCLNYFIVNCITKILYQFSYILILILHPIKVYDNLVMKFTKKPIQNKGQV